MAHTAMLLSLPAMFPGTPLQYLCQKGDIVMRLEIKPHSVDRFKAALDKRRELLRMCTNDMPSDWVDQMGEAERTICAAVSVAANRLNYPEQYSAQASAH